MVAANLTEDLNGQWLEVLGRKSQTFRDLTLESIVIQKDKCHMFLAYVGVSKELI